MVDSASNIDDYHEHFMGLNAARAYGLNHYRPHAPIVLKYERLNLL